MELKNHWIFTVILLTGTTLVASGEKKRRESVEESKALVYFPALPKSIITKDFGIRVGGSAGSGTVKDATPPTTSPKPTTTTEKLPLAQESHVASNSVTEPPGPTYLTESVYYSDQTPAPGSEEEDDIYQRERNEEEEEEEEKNREGELGLYLQSVSSYKPHFNGNRIILDPLMNPASMHYIPLGPNDKASPQTATITPTVSERFQISANTTTAYKPNKVPAQDSTIITTTEATRSHQITSTTPFFSEPSRTKSSISNSKPRRVHHKHTVVRPARIHKPIQKDSPNPKMKIALRPAYKPISPSPVSTKGFLPKPAPNPFAIKISKPVVQPIAPIRNGPPTTSSPPVSEAVKRVSTPSSAGFPSLVKKLGFINTVAESKGSFGERKKIGFRRKESLGRLTTNTPDTLVEEQSHRGFNFGFNKATENSPRSQYESPVVTSAPEKEAPVYRTSTKSFRAPTSLYQIRVSRGRTIAAPSQPDFIQTDSNIYVPHEYDEDAIPGEPGVDYPTYSQVPDTRFQCSSQSHPGLYADQNTDCQVFHICQEGGREDSFLCPNGTIFNQQYFVCDWWYNFSCETANDFYSLNALIYELPQTEDVVTRGSYT